jgi:hypothetical protein
VKKRRCRINVGKQKVFFKKRVINTTEEETRGKEAWEQTIAVI